MIRRLLALMLVFSVLSVSVLGAAHVSEDLGEAESGIHLHIGNHDHDHHHHDSHDHHAVGDHSYHHDHEHEHEEGGHIHLFFQVTSPSDLHIELHGQDKPSALQPIYLSRKLAPPVPPPNA